VCPNGRLTNEYRKAPCEVRERGSALALIVLGTHVRSGRRRIETGLKFVSITADVSEVLGDRLSIRNDHRHVREREVSALIALLTDALEVLTRDILPIGRANDAP
jgi:hypothetical protein